MTKETTSRGEDFRDNQLLWIVVRHFLGAAELRELCGEIVSAHGGDLSLGDICKEYRVPTQDSMGVWAISIKPTEDRMKSFLARFVQTVVWQGDQEAGLHGSEGDPEDVVVMQALELALRLSREDLVSFHWPQRDLTPLSDPLLPFLENMRRLQGDLGLGQLTFNPATSLVRGNSPLQACLIKHLGDLLADCNAWEWALRLYTEALTLLNGCDASEWLNLTSALKILFNQSIATANLMIGGREEALSIMDSLVAPPSGADFLAIWNGVSDRHHARRAVAPENFGRDERGSVVFSPQTIYAPRLVHAFENWAAKRFQDAQRWFWSVLRRQIAFGSYSERNETKAYYGLCVIDGIEDDLGKHRNESGFRMAIRLLIDSLRYQVVEKAHWSDELISTYVRQEVVETAINIAKEVPAEVQSRSNVIAMLFKHWLTSLPADRIQEAGLMIGFLSGLVVQYGRQFWAERNTGGMAMKILKEVGKDRPEFREVSSAAVCDAIVSGLKGRHPLELGEAIELADIYRKDFSEAELQFVVEQVLAVTENIPDGKADWPIMRPAIGFLSSIYVLPSSKDTSRGQRIAKEMLRLTLENENENSQAMFVLRNLDPALVEMNVSKERLAELVGSLEKKSQQTNSSASLAAIQALLVAPRLAGGRALEAALGGLEEILTIKNANRPSLILNDAYYPVIDLSKNKAEVGEMLGLTEEALRERMRPLATRICNIWKTATNATTIFSRFSIPPSNEADPTIVHNWSFASLAFGNAFDFRDEIDQAMATARQHRDLQKPMDVARVVFAAGRRQEDMSFFEQTESTAEAFYAGLGTRLLLVATYEPEKRGKALNDLLETCFKFGPDGQDVAVLLMANEFGVKRADSNMTRAYREKLLKSRSLRNSLVPVLRMIVVEEDHD